MSAAATLERSVGDAAVAGYCAVVVDAAVVVAETDASPLHHPPFPVETTLRQETYYLEEEEHVVVVVLETTVDAFPASRLGLGMTFSLRDIHS